MSELQHQIFLLEYFGRFFRGEIDEEFLRLWPAAQQAVEDMDGSPAQYPGLDELELKKAFARCFYGVGEFVVPLTKSSWENKEQLSVGASTRKASEVYAAAGVRIAHADHLPADHLGIMLAFAAELYRRGKAAEAEDFLSEFMSSWVHHAVHCALKENSSRELSSILWLFLRFVNSL